MPFYWIRKLSDSGFLVTVVDFMVMLFTIKLVLYHSSNIQPALIRLYIVPNVQLCLLCLE
jgi:hypothetical protein